MLSEILSRRERGLEIQLNLQDVNYSKSKCRIRD